MDQDFKDQERIYQYLQGTLKGPELSQFKADLQTNKALEEELAFSQAMMMTLKNKEALAVNHQLKGIISSKTIEPDFDALKEFETTEGLEDIPEQKSIQDKNWGKGLIGGALGLIVLTIFLSIFSGIWNPFLTNKAANPLVLPHLVPFENVISADAINNPVIEKGMAAYASENYVAAIPLLQNYLQDNKDANVRFYLGISHLLNLEAEKAIPILERTVDTSVPPMLEVAKWYLALAYIEAGQIPAARVTLIALQGTAVYEAKATALLLALENKNIQQ